MTDNTTSLGTCGQHRLQTFLVPQCWCGGGNDLTIGWQSFNPLSHPNATLAPQTRQSRASCENFKYATLAPQANFELVTELLV